MKWTCIVLALAVMVYADVDVFDEDDTGSFEFEAPKVFSTGSLLESAAELIAGTPVPLLLGITNQGSQPVNITTIGARLHPIGQPEHTLLNFSRRAYGIVANPGEQLTFEYAFKPELHLHAFEATLAADFTFSADDQVMQQSFFSQPVSFAAPPVAMTIADFFTYVLFGSVFFSVMYILYLVFTNDKNAKLGGVKSAKPVKGTRNEDSDFLDYVPAHLRKNASKQASK